MTGGRYDRAMSIAVALDDLAAEVARRGPGYLITATAGSRPHVLHLQFEVDGAELRSGVGRSAVRNIGAMPAVTLLWPPVEPEDYCGEWERDPISRERDRVKESVLAHTSGLSNGKPET